MEPNKRKRGILFAAVLLFIPGAFFWGYGLLAKRYYRPKVENPLRVYDTVGYAGLLKNTVSEGWVDYQKMGTAYSRELDRYLDAIARFGPKSTPEQFPSREHKLAYYLNAYNALMLRQILRKRIPKIVSRHVFIYTKWRIDGGWMTLHALEQDLIRPEFQESRIHFALVCAAVSCPPLRSEPYQAAALEQQLEDQARLFVGAQRGLRIQQGHVILSTIFKWYREDFEAAGGLKATLAKYLPEQDSRRPDLEKTKEEEFQFAEYDWTLNDISNRPKQAAVSEKTLQQ